MLFHTLWEMKSRYTLPYVIMLIPISAIGIQNIEDNNFIIYNFSCNACVLWLYDRQSCDFV